ncbi:unnamed protein product [Fusarium graminearum]|nr:unnamed protein product [Fusarium graminearum]
MAGDLCAIIRVDDQILRTDFPSKLSLSSQLFDVTVVQLRIVAVEVSHRGIEAAIECALYAINYKGGCDFVSAVKTADCTRGGGHLRAN